MVSCSFSSHSGRHTCEQCPEASGLVDASSKCLDCKMKLCENCREGHLKIKLLQGVFILILNYYNHIGGNIGKIDTIKTLKLNIDDEIGWQRILQHIILY